MVITALKIQEKMCHQVKKKECTQTIEELNKGENSKTKIIPITFIQC